MKDLERALMVAEKAHANQSYDIYPYMYHIKMVVEIAKDLGFRENIQVACALHDVLEDSDLSFNDIKKHFGIEVASIVYRVTDELGKNREERKERTYGKIRASWPACAVKVCDKIANVEYSKLYNKGLYEMYRKEHPVFKEALGGNEEMEGNKQRAWLYLNNLMN